MGNLWTEEGHLASKPKYSGFGGGRFRKDGRSGRTYFAEDHGQGTSGGY